MYYENTHGTMRIWAGLLLALGACGGPGDESEVCEQAHFAEDRSRALLDILFVVDTAPDMAVITENLPATVAELAAVLENIERGLPDVRIAFVSSDLGAGSSDLGAGGYEVAGCSGDGAGARFSRGTGEGGCTAPEAAFIEHRLEPWFTCGNPIDVPCRSSNYPGTLAEAMACLLPQPGSCEITQPLAAARRALDGSVAENGDFLREGAFLAVVYVGNGDDCSGDVALFDPDNADVTVTLGASVPFRCARAGIECAGTPLDDTPGSYEQCEARGDEPLLAGLSEERAGLLSLVADPGSVVVSVVGGFPGDAVTVLDNGGQPALAPACDNGAGVTATAGVRMNAFAQLFEQRNIQVSACESSYAEVLLLVDGLYRGVPGIPCYSGVVVEDADPAASGLQLPCTGELVGGAAAEELPRCVMADAEVVAAESPLPCWWAYDSDPGNAECGLRIRVERGGRTWSSGGALVTCPVGCDDG